MSKIMIQDMYFHYAEYFHPVFEQVNLNLDTDWKLGLIGRNGRGKTTFLKLLKGDLEPVRGKIRKDVVMEYFPYEVRTGYEMTLDVLKEIIGGFRSQEDVMDALLRDPTPENLEKYATIQGNYSEAGGYEAEGNIRKELYLMGLPEGLLARPFQVLSGGERSKMLMLALFLRPNTFILMDEPTNHLDIRGKQEIAGYLRRKSGFLAVSHDRQFLDEVADHILAINKCDITLEKGNYSSWKDNVEKKEVFEFRTRANLEKEIDVLERGAVVRRTWAAVAEKEKYPYKNNHRGCGTRAAKFMRQAKNAEQQAREDIAYKKELLKNFETVPELILPGGTGQEESSENRDSSTEKGLLVQLNGLSFSYGERKLFRNFSISIAEGERIWIRGSNGCGKSTLLKLLNGELESESRSCSEEIQISFSYQEPLWQDGYAVEKIGEGERREKFLDLCRCLDITEELLKRPLESYSSGEKKKVDVARALSLDNDLILLDEPLNFMDIYFREQLERAVLAYHPTLVFVEHDERFGSRVATRTVNLEL